MTLPSYAMNVSSFPEMYERWLVQPLFRPFAEVLLDRVELPADCSVLDVACGTGIVARLARQRLAPPARIVGVDLSAPMLSVARSVAPDVDWREGNATALPVGDRERFDVVLCQQGLQFFQDRMAAAREMHRVMVPGGRLAIATWLPLGSTPFFREAHAIAERHVGTIADQRHAFGVAANVRTLLGDAGFTDVGVDTVTLRLRFAEPRTLLHMNAMALVGMSAAGKSMTEDERARTAALIGEQCAELLPRYDDGGALAFELSTNLATARR